MNERSGLPQRLVNRHTEYITLNLLTQCTSCDPRAAVMKSYLIVRVLSTSYLILLPNGTNMSLFDDSSTGISSKNQQTELFIRVLYELRKQDVVRLSKTPPAIMLLSSKKERTPAIE